MGGWHQTLVLVFSQHEFPGGKFQFFGNHCPNGLIGKGRGTPGSLEYLPSCQDGYNDASSIWCNAFVKQGAVLCKTAHLVKVERKLVVIQGCCISSPELVTVSRIHKTCLWDEHPRIRGCRHRPRAHCSWMNLTSRSFIVLCLLSPLYCPWSQGHLS